MVAQMVRYKSQKKAEEKYKAFSELYTKFVAGQKWLDAQAAAGTVTQKDKDDYVDNVCAPLAKMWDAFTPEERTALKTVTRVVEECGAKKITYVPEWVQEELV